MASKFNILPLSEDSNEDVGSEFSVENLGNQIEIRNKCSLEDNGCIGGVEKLDWVLVSNTSDFIADKRNINSPTL